MSIYWTKCEKWKLKLFGSMCPHQSIQKLQAGKKRFDENPLIFPMGTDVVHVTEDPLYAINRDPGVTEIEPIGCPRAHCGNDSHARPHLLGDFLDWCHYLLRQR